MGAALFLKCFHSVGKLLMTSSVWGFDFPLVRFCMLFYLFIPLSYPLHTLIMSFSYPLYTPVRNRD